MSDLPRGGDDANGNRRRVRRHLAAELDRVIDDAEELVATRSGRPPVVIVPLTEYESMKETDYLLRTPANAAALRRSIAELEGDPPTSTST